jgi:hypothetical protein
VATLFVVLLHDEVTLEVIRFSGILFPDRTFFESFLFAIECSAFDIEVDSYLEQHATQNDGGTVLLHLFQE